MTRSSTAPGAASPPTVLFVDDDPLILHAIRRVLHRQPYSLLTATSPREALQLLEVRRVAVVVADQNMPEMLGSEFLCRVRRDFAAVGRILLTGGADDVARDCEPCRLLRKPVHPTELNQAILDVVGMSPPGDVRSRGYGR